MKANLLIRFASIVFLYATVGCGSKPAEITYGEWILPNMGNLGPENRGEDGRRYKDRPANSTWIVSITYEGKVERNKLAQVKLLRSCLAGFRGDGYRLVKAEISGTKWSDSLYATAIFEKQEGGFVTCVFLMRSTFVLAVCTHDGKSEMTPDQARILSLIHPK